MGKNIKKFCTSRLKKSNLNYKIHMKTNEADEINKKDDVIKYDGNTNHQDVQNRTIEIE